ncbi:MAG TPA: DNA internalization-related competence protein ComEC/Rec2 [Gemmatimonadaceae bacterium]|nr:DNA internalization-related competence protein ComEC/Rec2 [Gemmatimonadaceae bacterium]
MPLVAWAFLAYATGLLTAFLGSGAPARVACATAIASSAIAVGLRRWILLALSALFLSGLVVAGVAPPPPPRWEVAHGALEPVRSELGRRIDRIFGSDAQIARALLIADQRQMPLEIRDRYATAGLVHMLSISGLHVSIIASSLELLLLALRFRRRLAICLSVALVFGYVAVLDWRAPAFRAAVMYGTVSLARGLQRPVSPWAALAIGGWLPLIAPRTVLELGYQLSLCGMAALTAAGIVGRRLRIEQLGPIRSRVLRDLLASTFASVTTAPLVAWYFGRVSLIGPIANLFAGPVIAILQPTLFLALALSPATGAASFIGDAAHPLFAAFDGIATTAAGLPFAGLDIAPTLLVTVASGVAAVAMVVAAAGRRTGRALLVGCLALGVVAWLPLVPRPLREVELHVLDVGQGDAVALRTDRGNWVLFDAGRAWKKGDAGRSVVIPYVRRRGGAVLGLVLSHPHADHVGGAASLLRWLRPPLLWDPAYVGPTQSYRDALAVAESRGTEWRRVIPGDSMVADGVRIIFLAPDSAWAASLDDPNEASAVALVRYGDTRLLLTGDAERGEEEWLLRHARDLLDVDVLKVAHHGSRTSSGAGFLDATTPRLALISVGAENAYRHPNAEVLERLRQRRIRVLRTDHHGAIVVRTNGTDIRVRHGGGDWLLLPR